MKIIPPQYKLAALIIGVVLAVGSASVLTWKMTSDHYTAQITTINAQHEKWIADNQLAVAEKLLDATNSRATAYQELNEVRGKLDERYQTDITSIARDIAGLRNVKLRDPGSQTPANGSSGSAGAGSSPGTGGSEQASSGAGVLSEQTTEFLLGFAGEAETVSATLRTCLDWKAEVERKMVEYNKSIKH